MLTTSNCYCPVNAVSFTSGIDVFVQLDKIKIRGAEIRKVIFPRCGITQICTPVLPGDALRGSVLGAISLNKKTRTSLLSNLLYHRYSSFYYYEQLIILSKINNPIFQTWEYYVLTISFKGSNCNCSA